MKRLSIWLGILLFLFFAGCTPNNPSPKNKAITKSAMIVWKTPIVKYVDMGFISDDRAVISAEIYGAGSALMRLKIQRKSICMSQFRCMSKKEFNTKLLSPHYPPELLTHIFRGQAIFAGVSARKTSRGFSQHIISANRYDIEYSVTKRETLFWDRLNNITIKIKNIE